MQWWRCAQLSRILLFTVQASLETGESDSVADAVVELYTTLRILFLQCKLVLENSECEMILQHFSAAIVELYTKLSHSCDRCAS